MNYLQFKIFTLNNHKNINNYFKLIALYNLNIKRFIMEEFPAFDEKEYLQNMSAF
jgi:hypothetical protein